MENLEVEKKRSGPRKAFIIILIFVLISLGVGTLFYRNNKTFKYKANRFLAKVPGPIGKYFGDFPTAGESAEKKQELANYFLSLEPDSAADKLYILKKQDEQLFNEVIKIMNSLSSSKTEEILKLIRNIELRKNSLSSIYDSIQYDVKGDLKDEVSKLEGMDTLLAVSEIERRIETDKEFAQNIPHIINYMDENKASQILYCMDPSLREKILLQVDKEKRANLDSLILKKEAEEKKYEDLANLYETKDVKASLEEIGNTETYSIEELGKIYSSLSVAKSAEILSKVKDDEFMEELFSNIRREEELKRLDESITLQLSEAIQFVNEYDKKVKNLVGVYEKMAPEKVANIVEKMMTNDQTVTSLEVNSTPIYEISDASIILDVLNRMKKSTVSKIMSNMNAEKSSILTQRMVKP